MANKCNMDAGVCQCGDTGNRCDGGSAIPKCLSTNGVDAALEGDLETCQVTGVILFVTMSSISI